VLVCSTQRIAMTAPGRRSSCSSAHMMCASSRRTLPARCCSARLAGVWWRPAHGRSQLLYAWADRRQCGPWGRVEHVNHAWCSTTRGQQCAQSSGMHTRRVQVRSSKRAAHEHAKQPANRSAQHVRCGAAPRRPQPLRRGAPSARRRETCWWAVALDGPAAAADPARPLPPPLLLQR
jgi:hypothetical protein